MLSKQISLAEENETLREVFLLQNVENLVGNSEAMHKVLKEIESVSQSSCFRNHNRGKRYR